MNNFDIAIIASLTALLMCSLYTDLRFGKIYNKLTLPCILFGIILNTTANGLQGALLSVGGAALTMILFLLFAPVAGIGGGDIKLMMAVGALVGLKIAVWAVLYTAVAGGVLALIVMASNRVLLTTTKRMASGMYMSVLTRTPVGIADHKGSIKFKYSPAIALGTMLACYLNRL